MDPKKWLIRRPRQGGLIERAMSNLHAAESLLLDIAPPRYLLDSMPSVLSHVQRHLIPTDPRRQELERTAQRLGIKDTGHALLQGQQGIDLNAKLEILKEERGKIATAMRAASSAALREQVRLRDFRNTVMTATALMTLLAIAVAVTGVLRPTLIPLCFTPEEAGQAMVVCPTAQSGRFPASSLLQPPASPGPTAEAAPSPTTSPPSPALTNAPSPAESTPGPSNTESGSTPGTAAADVDYYTQETASHLDLLLIEFVGLIAAAVAAAAAIRGIQGSSERHGTVAALALLKLPTGAITAFLGLLLMRGRFVPGLSALDTSAQILAWALVFGYAQELFTRLVDQQGQIVLNSIRGADKAQTPPKPP